MNISNGPKMPEKNTSLNKSKRQNAYFRKNIGFLKKLDSKLAYQLQMVDPAQLEFCYSENEQLNLKRVYQNKTYYYHSEIDPLKEAQNWFSELQLTNETVIFVYGIGLGYYFEAARKWLKDNPKHSLVFLETDLGVLYRLFETKLGSELLRHPQVRIMHFREMHENKELFSELSWIYILCPFKISYLKLYYEVDSEECQELSHRLSYDIEQRNVLVDEYLSYGISFFINFYANLLEIPLAYSGDKLFNQFKDKPAIICGAGPSLNKNIETLKKLHSKALIFGGSSSLPALVSSGVIPHFGAAIDPNQAQLSRVMSVQKHSIPFFYRNRLFHEALKAITGPKLYITGTGGYEVARWFDYELKIAEELADESEELDEGNNVINFCIAIAASLGCNPIILTGVDLAFTNNEYYAGGVAKTLNLTEEDLKNIAAHDPERIIKKDIYGKPIETLWKWIAESEWITKFAKEHPELTLINATEGGIGCEDIPNMTLKEVQEKYLKKEWNISKDIEEKIKPLSLATIKKDKIIQLMKQLQKSLKKCIEYFSQLSQEMDFLLKDLKTKKTIPETLETQKSLLLELDIQEEVAQEFILDIFNVVYTRLRHRDIHAILFPKRKMSLQIQQKKKIQLQKDRLKFLIEVAKVNIEIIEATLKQTIS